MANNDINVEIDEFNLEDLIVLGDDKKIPIEITFPRNDGSKVNAKALIKQLTLREMENLNVSRTDIVGANLMVLRKALFKANGDNFTNEELEALPLGVVNALANQILEVSGVDVANQKLGNF